MHLSEAGKRATMFEGHGVQWVFGEVLAMESFPGGHAKHSVTPVVLE